MSRQASPGELDPAPGTEVVPELRARTQDKVPGLEAECGPRRDSWADPKEGSVGPITGPWMLPTGRKGEAATVKLHPEPIPGSGMLRFGTGDGGDGDPILRLRGVASFRVPSSRGARGQGGAENHHEIIKNPTKRRFRLCSKMPSPKSLSACPPGQSVS